MRHLGHRRIHPRCRLWANPAELGGSGLKRPRESRADGERAPRPEHVASGKRRVSHCVAPLIVAHLGPRQLGKLGGRSEPASVKLVEDTPVAGLICACPYCFGAGLAMSKRGGKRGPTAMYSWAIIFSLASGRPPIIAPASATSLDSTQITAPPPL